jgi:SAM-dependent methyltransferase
MQSIAFGPAQAPSTALTQLSMAMRASQALFVAAELGLADLIARGAHTSVALAHHTNANADAIRRLLRALCALGVFVEGQDDHFSLTEIGESLRSDASDSYRAAVLFLAGRLRWNIWADLLGSVRTGRSSPERNLGMHIFDYYATDHAEAEIQDEAMEAMSSAASEAVLAAYDFSLFKHIVDVGGGTGRLLAAILSKHPNLRGTLLDLPHVVGRASAVASASCVRSQMTIAGGSFFDAVPEGADAYILKQVLHDWDDPRALQILKACRAAMRPGAVLLIMERVLPEKAEPGASTLAFLTDLEMLVCTPGGRERTAKKFEDLLQSAGFSLNMIAPTSSILSIIEAEVGDDKRAGRLQHMPDGQFNA